ncbi:MAG: type II toxin-antitoxin system VapC family toxin [Flammeovirgaceae bacterium]
MIVVVVNVMAYLWLPSQHNAVINELLVNDKDWNSSFLWRSEFRNILIGFVRRKQYTLAQAIEIQEKAENQMKGREFVVQSSNVLGLTERSTCSAYDCEYVALASQLNVNLITYGKQVIHAFPEIAMTAEQYLTNLKK